MPPALPKLSYVLLSHNREKYIRAAIESAFAQDYEGELEYIFSDDCSTDRTFEIIKECVAAYKGNRRIVVTRTPRNLHLAGNTNHAMQFVESDWIVRADDDDISTPDRCTIVGKAIAENPGCTYVYTRLKNFSDGAAVVLTKEEKANSKIERINILSGEDDIWESFFAPGILHQVWSFKHFTQFGPLPEDGYWVDDVICNMRCCSLGYGIIIPEVTAYIRNNSGNMSQGGARGDRGYHAIIRLEQFNDNYQNTTLSPLRRSFETIVQFLQTSGVNAERFIKSMEDELATRELLCTFWRKGIFNRIRISHKLGYRGLFSMLRCLPLPLFACLQSLYRALFK